MSQMGVKEAEAFINGINDPEMRRKAIEQLHPDVKAKIVGTIRDVPTKSQGGEVVEASVGDIIIYALRHVLLGLLYVVRAVPWALYYLSRTAYNGLTIFIRYLKTKNASQFEGWRDA